MNGSIIEQIQRLRAMPVAELQRTWAEVFGESSRSRNRTFLWRRIAWELQAREYGRLGQRALDRIRELAPEAHPHFRPPRGATNAIERIAAASPPMSGGTHRDPRLPAPGSTIVKRYRGRDLHVVVHADHFEFEGRSFDSLSRLAAHVTGTSSRINGWLFFGLTQRSRRS